MHELEKMITVTELAGRLGAVLDAVQAGEEFVVTRHGVPLAVLGPLSEAAAVGGRSEPVARETAAVYGAASTPTVARQPQTALVRLVGSESVRGVLALFLREPDRTLYQRDIARRAGIGLRSAQLALDRLERLGLLTSARDGNRRYYRAVRTSRFEDLRALLSRELGVAEIITRHLSGLDARVEWAFIFGSVAAGDDTFDSDIDLVVVTEASDDALVSPIAEAQRELGRDIDLVTYRPEEFVGRRTEGNHFVRSILAQPRIDLIGGPDDA